LKALDVETQHIDVKLHPVTGSKSSTSVEVPYLAQIIEGDAVSEGSWGTIYDEGFVIDVPSSEEMIFYGHFGFERTSKMRTESSSALSPDSSGYVSHCNVVPGGWLIRRGTSGQATLHCFRATQLEKSFEIPQLNTTHLHQSISPTLTEFKTPHWEFQMEDSPKKKNQGSCGSCFVLSYAYAMERIVMNLYDSYGIGDSNPLSLDREAILSCSVANQGCSGGFYNSLTLDLMVSGAPLSGCMVTHEMSFSTGRAQPCKDMCYKDKTELIYTAGFNDLQGEDEIKNFLVKHGPVPVGISMTAEHHNSLRAGSQSSIIHLPNDPPSENWDKLNHGVVIIGWGTSTDGQPYWDIYNPWGGGDTFAKIFRKPNGVPERNAIGIKIDICKGKIHKDLIASGKDPEECNKK
jgi:hypothetical protein